MKINELLKHPILVVVISISYFFALQSFMPHTKTDAEIRAAFQELETISKELAESEEPGHIKAVIQNFGEQVVDGFKAGFKSDNQGLIKFIEAKPNIFITETQKAKSAWKTKEKIIGKITNKSTHTITQIKVAFSSFSEDGRLIDVNSNWLSDIKVLRPNDSVFFSVERSIGEHGDEDHELKSNESYSYKLEVTGFEIKDIDLKHKS